MLLMFWFLVHVIFFNLGMNERDLIAIGTPEGLTRVQDVMTTVTCFFLPLSQKVCSEPLHGPPVSNKTIGYNNNRDESDDDAVGFAKHVSA